MVMRNAHLLSIVIFSCFSASVSGQNKSIELVFAETGAPGTTVVTVWSYSPKATIDDDLVLENAVKGCIFNGIKENKEKRIIAKTALLPDGETANADYFDSFFKTGEYRDFCRMGMNGYVEQGNLIKLKRGYRIGKLVVINYDDLRRKLEKDGIIRGLDSGF